MAVRVRELLPAADILYVADQGRAPYGRRPLDEVRGYAVEVAGRLIDEGAGMVGMKFGLARLSGGLACSPLA